MPTFICTVSEPVLESRYNSTQTSLLKTVFSGVGPTRPACNTAATFQLGVSFYYLLEKADGEGNWVILGLKLFHVWAGHTVGPFMFPSCGLVSVHGARSCAHSWRPRACFQGLTLSCCCF